jgi:hypothetical protein
MSNMVASEWYIFLETSTKTQGFSNTWITKSGIVNILTKHVSLVETCSFSSGSSSHSCSPEQINRVMKFVLVSIKMVS